MTCATEISKVEEKRLKTIESIKNICVEKFADDSLICLLYTSDAADERSSVDLGGRRIIIKKTNR
mgnify:CR=1 FL=1